MSTTTDTTQVVTPPLGKPHKPWHRRKLVMIPAVGLAAAAVCMVAACSSSSSASSGGQTQSPSTSQGPGGIPVIGTARHERPFPISYQQNNAPASFILTFDSIKCGSGSIFDPRVLDANGPVATPTPLPGDQFCLVKFTVTNKSAVNQSWSATGGTLNVGSKAYEYDNVTNLPIAEQYDQAATEAGMPVADEGLNPDTTGVSYAEFQIPAKDHPSSFSVPAGGYTLDSTQIVVTIS